MESPPCWDRTDQMKKCVAGFPDRIFCFTSGREKSCAIWRQTLSPWIHNITENFQGEVHLWKSSNLQTYLSRVTEDRNHPLTTVTSALSCSDTFRLFSLSEKAPVLSLKIQHSRGLLSLTKWLPRYQASSSLHRHFTFHPWNTACPNATTDPFTQIPFAPPTAPAKSRGLPAPSPPRAECSDFTFTSPQALYGSS